VGCQVLFAQLFLQGFVEGGGVGEGDFLRPVVAASVVFLQLVVGDVVFRQVVAQRVVVGVPAVLGAFRVCASRVGIVVRGRFFLAFFEGGVLQQFGAHAVLQLHGG